MIANCAEELTGVLSIADYWAADIRYKLLYKEQNFVEAIYGDAGCQPIGSKVLMANGEWKNIEDIKIGDEVISPQSDGSNTFAKVTELHTFESPQIYEIYKNDKHKELMYKCAHNHEIPFYNYKTKGHFNRSIRREIAEQTAEELNKLVPTTYKRTIFSSFPIKNFKDKINCEVEPYTLGVFLGDGSFPSRKKVILNKNFDKIKRKDKLLWVKRWERCVNITSANPSIMAEISKFYPIKNILLKKGTEAKRYDFSMNGELAKQLIRYGLEGKLSGDKFIPKEALCSDINYRKRLLAGLIDTDGYLSRYLSYSICTKSKQLAEDILWLVRSLGGKGHISKIKKSIKSINFIGEYYNIGFYLGKIIYDLPFKNKKKVRNQEGFCYLSSNRHSFKLVKKEGERVYGFTIDSPSHWYITDNFMVTKNSGKSTTAIAQACKLDATFNIDRIVFAGHEYTQQLKVIKPGQFIVWEEVGVNLNSREAMTKMNKDMSYVLQTMRFKQNGLIMTVPDASYLDKSARLLIKNVFETQKILSTYKLCLVKPYIYDRRTISGEVYHHFPVITIGQKRITINQFAVHKPNDELLKAYKEKKNAFFEEHVLGKIDADYSIDEIKLETKRQLLEEQKTLIADKVNIVMEQPRIYGKLKTEGWMLSKSRIKNAFNVDEKVAEDIKAQAEMKLINRERTGGVV